jgi:predicted dehydrogenase
VSRLRVGIAGCGLIAGGPVRDGRPILGTHAAACREEPTVELVAAADLHADRRAAFGAWWKVDALFADVETMCSKAAIDLLIVATPPGSHEAVCQTGLARGVRGILCEKPLGGEPAAARRICEAARAAKVPLVVNFSRRWDDNHQLVARRIADGAIGEPRVVFGLYTGTLRGNGSHLVDTLRMVVPGEWTVRWTSALARGATDGAVAATLRSDAGAIAQLAPVAEADYFVFELDVVGTRGRVRLLERGNEVRLELPRESADFPGYRFLHTAEELPRGTLPSTFRRALATLAAAVSEGRAVPLQPEAVIGTLSLLDQIVNRAVESPEEAKP